MNGNYQKLPVQRMREFHPCPQPTPPARSELARASKFPTTRTRSLIVSSVNSDRDDAAEGGEKPEHKFDARARLYFVLVQHSSFHPLPASNNLWTYDPVLEALRRSEKPRVSHPPGGGGGAGGGAGGGGPTRARARRRMAALTGPQPPAHTSSPGSSRPPKTAAPTPDEDGGAVAQCSRNTARRRHRGTAYFTPIICA